MARRTARSSNQRNTTSTTAETRGDVICELTSRGGWTKTRHSTATMTMAEEEGSNLTPNRMIVAYSEATATIAGTTACAPASTAIIKLFLARTGCVIWYPLNRRRRSGRRPATADLRHNHLLLSTLDVESCVTYLSTSTKVKSIEPMLI